MAHSDQALPLTRREFYGALTIVWAYIWLLIGDRLLVEERWATGILWLASLLMVVTYSWQVHRSRPAVGTENKTAGSGATEDRPRD